MNNVFVIFKTRCNGVLIYKKINASNLSKTIMGHDRFVQILTGPYNEGVVTWQFFYTVFSMITVNIYYENKKFFTYLEY